MIFKLNIPNLKVWIPRNIPNLKVWIPNIKMFRKIISQSNLTGFGNLSGFVKGIYLRWFRLRQSDVMAPPASRRANNAHPPVNGIRYIDEAVGVGVVVEVGGEGVYDAPEVKPVPHTKVQAKKSAGSEVFFK